MARYTSTHQEARVKAALSSMPFGAMERLRRAAARVGGDDHGQPCPVDLDSLAIYLETLRDVLTEDGRQTEKELVELRHLRDDVAAMRRVLGIPTAAQLLAELLAASLPTREGA